MAINKIPKNYYSDTNIRRDKINEIIDEVNDIASIPSPSAADAGKVVKVSEEGEYELADDTGTVLPAPTIADSGKVVKVSDEGSYELADDEGTVLPVPTAADAGKVLAVDNQGAWELENIPKQCVVVPMTVGAQGYVPSITLDEFNNFINNGVTIIFKVGVNFYHIYANTNNYVLMVFNDLYTDNNTKYIEFTWIVLDKSTWIGTVSRGYTTLT